jgi:N-methylhydantoinase A
MTSGNGTLAEHYAIGVDIGGTFTDCVVVSARGRVATGKVPTTPTDRSTGFFGSITAAAASLGVSDDQLLASCERLVHGTTTGTNAIVSRTGSVVGLLTTAGHTHVMRLMKGSGRTIGLPSDQTLDAPSTDKPEPLVPTQRTRGVRERVDVDGEIVVPLNEEDVEAAVRELLDAGVESFAVSFLFSTLHPRHEQRTRELIGTLAPGAFVSLASDLSSRRGEYERTAAAVANAYIGPLMDDYVSAIESGARERGYAGPVLFAQAAGGAITVDEARAVPLRTVQSGPAAGVVASAMLARRIGRGDVIAADVGGTTLDVSVIHRGEPVQRDISLMERFAMAQPMLDVESIGAGGGSIAWVDAWGRLNVGPKSAGADPGPAAYGRGGTEPTVTDADVVLGLIDPDNFLDGRMRLDRSLAEEAIRPLAERLGLSVLETAAGINRVVDAKMADLIRRVSLLRGFDPRKFDCYAFGGGGPVHMTAVAAESGIRRVVVPVVRTAAVWSALGAASSDVTHLFEEWRVIDLPTTGAVVQEIFDRLEGRARDVLVAEGFDADDVQIRRSVRMRYAMQVHDVEVPVTYDQFTDEAVQAIDADFDRVHDELFGKDSGFRQGGVQFTGFQLRAVGVTPKPDLAAQDGAAVEQTSARSVYWYELGDSVETPVYRTAGARPGTTVAGPALLELPDSVIVVRPGQAGTWDELGDFVIETTAVPA